MKIILIIGLCSLFLLSSCSSEISSRTHAEGHYATIDCFIIEDGIIGGVQYDIFVSALFRGNRHVSGSTRYSYSGDDNLNQYDLCKFNSNGYQIDLDKLDYIVDVAVNDA